MAIYYYFRLVFAMLKMREHGCLHYYILFCGEWHSKQIHCQRRVRFLYLFTSAAVKSIFYDLQKFNLETCTEKPEVDIMMPLLVAEAEFIHWQRNRKQLSHSAETRWDFAKTTQPKVNYPSFRFEGFLWSHIRNIYVTACHRRIKIYSLDSETPFSYLLLIHL